MVQVVKKIPTHCGCCLVVPPDEGVDAAPAGRAADRALGTLAHLQPDGPQLDPVPADEHDLGNHEADGEGKDELVEDARLVARVARGGGATARRSSKRTAAR